MSESFTTLVQLMAKLRAPDGCPWDRKQTHESLKPYLVEEAYEVLEAIDHGNSVGLREELGDLALQILFHAQIAAEAGTFTIDDVLQQLADKLVRRHPHVFAKGGGNGAPGNAEEVVARWEDIKRNERRQQADASRAPDSVLSGVPKTLPALLRAYQVQARASRVGFDWPHSRRGRELVMNKIEEEVRELCEALGSLPNDAANSASDDAQRRLYTQVEAEFGDLLFALVNLGRFIKVNPEDALRQATNRFTERFRYIEQEAARGGRRLDQMTLAEMDVLWEEAKRTQATPKP
jgi:tetrapyrrole methylase family protein/MazG family protein